MFRYLHRRSSESDHDDRETGSERAPVITVSVQCLGVFRELGDDFDVDVESRSVLAIRNAVSAHLVKLNRPDLDRVLRRSIFAEGDELLKDHIVIEGSTVSLLPPVAGG